MKKDGWTKQELSYGLERFGIIIQVVLSKKFASMEYF